MKFAKIKVEQNLLSKKVKISGTKFAKTKNLKMNSFPPEKNKFGSKFAKIA